MHGQGKPPAHAPLCQRLGQGFRRLVPLGVGAMGVDENVGIRPQSTSATFVHGLANACPFALAPGGLQAPAPHARIPEQEGTAVAVLAKRETEASFDQGTKGHVLSRRVSLGEPCEVVRNLDGCFQYGSPYY